MCFSYLSKLSLHPPTIKKKQLAEFLLYQHHLKKGVKVRKNLLDEVVGMVPRQPTPNLMEVVSEDLSLHNRPL
jgi:hypothetical protein